MVSDRTENRVLVTGLVMLAMGMVLMVVYNPLIARWAPKLIRGGCGTPIKYLDQRLQVGAYMIDGVFFVGLAIVVGMFLTAIVLGIRERFRHGKAAG